MKYVVLSIILVCGVMLADSSWSEPVKLPDCINLATDTVGNRFHAHISPDGTELYFTADVYKYADDIYVARYDKETDTWDSVTRLSINRSDIRRELSPSITADHSRIYWCSWNTSEGYGTYDVWYAEWSNSKHDWGTPKNCGPNVNTPGAEFTCFIAPDGKSLYVSSDYDSDCDDIYKFTLQPDSTWGPRERVFEDLHPGTCEYSPWVSADGKWLYFSWWTGTTYGDAIYRAHWQGEYFGTPEMLPEPISLPGDLQMNNCPSLSPDGSRLYFASNRPDAGGEYIWYSNYLGAIEEQPYADSFNLSVSSVSRNKVVINYTLTQPQEVFCGIFDTAGNLVRILVSDTQQGGENSLVWNGLDSRGRVVANGTYFVQLTVNRQRVARKTIYLR